MHRGLWILLGLLLSAGLPALSVARAQTDAAADAQTVAVGEYDFPTNDKEPLEFHVTYRLIGQDGSYAQGYVVVQLPDGTFTGLTPCDNSSIACLPVTLPAKGALALADPGDSFPLAKETMNGQ